MIYIKIHVTLFRERDHRKLAIHGWYTNANYEAKGQGDVGEIRCCARKKFTGHD